MYIYVCICVIDTYLSIGYLYTSIGLSPQIHAPLGIYMFSSHRYLGVPRLVAW